MWLPSSDHKYCRKLQMAAPLPNSAHNAMEMDPELAPVAALTTWIPFHAGRDQGGGSCTTLFPKRARPSARVPARVPERGEGWGRICGEGSGALLVQRSCAPSQDYAAPPLSSPAWLLPVLNDFCVLCLILPFTCSCSPSPQLPRLHSGMLRRPRVGAPLLSPRCNSHAAARFLFKHPTPPPKPLAFSPAGQGSSLLGTIHRCRRIRGRVRASERGRAGCESPTLTTPFCFILRGKLLAGKRRCG